MATFDLSIEDLENFDLLIRITKTINNLYKKLYELEINSLKDSLEYKKTLDNLRIAIEVENEKYASLNLTLDRCFSFLQYLIECKLPSDLSNTFTSIVNMDYDNCLYRRILNIIERKISLFYGETLVLDNDLKEKEVIARIYNIKNLHDAVKWETQIRESIFVDIYIFYLYFLNLDLNNPNNSDIRDDLQRSKYYLAFIDKEVEDNLLRNDFKIALNPFYYSEYIKSIESIPTNFYDNRKGDLIEDIVVSLIANLMKLQDNFLKVKKYKLIQLFLSYLLKSSLVVDNVTGNLVINLFFDNVGDIDKLQNSTLSVKVIKEAQEAAIKNKIFIEKEMFQEDGNNK